MRGGPVYMIVQYSVRETVTKCVTNPNCLCNKVRAVLIRHKRNPDKNATWVRVSLYSWLLLASYFGILLCHSFYLFTQKGCRLTLLAWFYEGSRSSELNQS